jgi:hypothetical protein
MAPPLAISCAAPATADAQYSSNARLFLRRADAVAEFGHLTSPH